jgi:hypothetical protein
MHDGTGMSTTFEEELRAARLATRANMDAKLAATIAKFRATTEKIKAARPTTKVTEYVPPKNAEPPTAAAKRAATAASKREGPKCHAVTLEGRKCQFGATCGMFCKKHFSMM